MLTPTPMSPLCGTQNITCLTVRPQNFSGSRGPGTLVITAVAFEDSSWVTCSCSILGPYPTAPRIPRAITGWYERNIGYVPNSIAFGLEMHPEFVKMNRVKWESAIVTLPKQVAPHVMIRLNMMSGNVQGLREAVLLGRNWGISREPVFNGINASVMYFTAFEGLHAASRASRDILRDWAAEGAALG